ncbi:MAG: DUF4349 domain-containing protein, partial [Saprospiraceae bacterium]|nr:DUF4349 domain-containing protein [Saprospiraceae bacterium]
MEKEMKMKTALYALVLFALILAACARAPAATQAPAARDLASASAVESGTSPEAYSNKAGAADIAAQQPAAVNRLVIKNADLIIVVADPSVGMTAILEMANEMGGYVVLSKSFKIRSQNSIEVPQANITVRVPSDK